LKAKFIYESISDLLEPKSETDIIKELSKLYKEELNYKLVNEVKRNEESLVKLILDAGANVNAKDYSVGFTPLLWAVNNGFLNLVKLLIEYGADVNYETTNGNTVLIQSIRINNHINSFKITEILLNAGANPNKKNKFNQSSLSWAKHHGYKDKINLLIKYGAKLD